MNKYIIPGLLAITLATSLYSCIAIIAVRETVQKLEEEDRNMQQQLANNLTPPPTCPKLADTLAYYKTEKKTMAIGQAFGDNKYITITIHRFFFKRAEYTDSLFNGFSIIVADFGNQKMLIENQDNVTLAFTSLGEPISNWQTELNSLTTNKEPVNDLSDDGLRTKTFIRSNKI